MSSLVRVTAMLIVLVINEVADLTLFSVSEYVWIMGHCLVWEPNGANQERPEPARRQREMGRRERSVVLRVGQRIAPGVAGLHGGGFVAGVETHGEAGPGFSA